MLTEQKMKAALQQYLDGFNQQDADAIITLFADNARIEDPVGSEQIVQGKEAITTFYKGAVKVVERLELDTPIRSSYSNYAAMAFTIHMVIDGQKRVTRAIDVMTFDNTGKIIDMKAYHGPSDSAQPQL
ncbi:steroid delta-isomerase [Ammoniphilus oxalaticus]|uniref:Steroid delta-isomerase n=1 Tax=Ammoniphilus oxalaticus TaxID=66863 RepID=A0A419SNI6_9BACL|nr:nuclear transport factor 2 family protein [Ammoniphilus oxalaticus]RKD25856.1 steroid delta-isomerase [Ammoniphilus oxalaticus]